MYETKKYAGNEGDAPMFIQYPVAPLPDAKHFMQVDISLLL